jgi:RHH-type proline utilization regulon transcriptional repressor/proline dehydrogenase/delta 1-pyrroline-5-carboxylate dehydrogenase
MDWGTDPKVNISVKPSALCANVEGMDFDEVVEHMLSKIKPVYRQVVDLNGFLCIDIETLRLREITFELYRRLRSDEEFRHYPHLGLAMQVYFKDHAEKLDEMLAWARSESLPISIRQIKGAYWDYEVALAEENNEPVPVYTIKAQSDIAFERAARKILQNSDICHLACASHNVRSVIALMETARMLDVGDDRLEFQVLYGMAEPFRKAILKMTPRVRLYCPHGDLLRGMAYLVRRLIENSSNESFLQMTLAKGADIDRLLENPSVTLEREKKEALV